VSNAVGVGTVNVMKNDREKGKEHISVCICTYKRPNLLDILLDRLEGLKTEDLFTYSLVIVDNDDAESARTIVDSFAEKSRIPVRYDVEPEQNIALARNRAVQNASGNYVTFIDDDEFPRKDWLLNLYNGLQKYKADGVLGPVLPHYEGNPPQWVTRGGFYDRPSHETGTVLDWENTRTGNVLLRTGIFREMKNAFRREFGRGGEDKDFFRRMIGNGLRFVWVAEAPVYEIVPPERFSRSFMLRRALLRGKIPHFTLRDLLVSLVAIPIYTSILPFLPLGGQHVFMKYLIRDFDHIGRVLAFCGLDVIKERYVMK